MLPVTTTLAIEMLGKGFKSPILTGSTFCHWWQHRLLLVLWSWTWKGGKAFAGKWGSEVASAHFLCSFPPIWSFCNDFSDVKVESNFWIAGKVCEENIATFEEEMGVLRSCQMTGNSADFFLSHPWREKALAVYTGCWIFGGVFFNGSAANMRQRGAFVYATLPFGVQFADLGQAAKVLSAESLNFATMPNFDGKVSSHQKRACPASWTARDKKTWLIQ